MASVPIDFAAADAAASTAMLSRSGVDICIVDHELPDREQAAVIAAARAARPAPLVFLSMPRGGQRSGTVDGVLASPQRHRCEKAGRALGARENPDPRADRGRSNTMRSIVRKILAASRFAFDVHEAAEGIGALEQIGSGNFGLVFLDYNMPGFNGIETLSEIRRIAPQVSVVMMTSTVDASIAERARVAGALRS